jgi:hypothetical protein
MPEGGLRDAGEVELLLTEDELARACWYCGVIEYEWQVASNDRFVPCGGEGYHITYMCSQVCSSHLVFFSVIDLVELLRCQKRSRIGRTFLSVIGTFS